MGAILVPLAKLRKSWSLEVWGHVNTAEEQCQKHQASLGYDFRRGSSHESVVQSYTEQLPLLVPKFESWGLAPDPCQRKGSADLPVARDVPFQVSSVKLSK